MNYARIPNGIYDRVAESNITRISGGILVGFSEVSADITNGILEEIPANFGGVS